MRKNLPDPGDFIGESLPRFPGYIIKEFLGNGANGLVFLAESQSIAGQRAFKVVPVENLPPDPDKLSEARKANMVSHQAVVQCAEVFPWRDKKTGRDFVIFVYDYIPGPSLREYIKSNRSDIDIPFIKSFLMTMFEVLFEFKLRGIKHGDLHAGNILVSKSQYDVHEKVGFRITDFGVAKITTGDDHSDDYLYVAQILKDLLYCIEYDEASPKDRYTYNILRNDYLKRHLIEDNLLADDYAQNPREMLTKLGQLDDEYNKAVTGKKSVEMKSPFDYPNCEQMGNSHSLLKSLYSNRLLGLSKIQEMSNLVLTGPRGCGKTAVFRALSLDYLVSIGEDSPQNLHFIGIYYRCDDLYFSFPRYKKPSREEAFDIPMHFVIVTLIAETLKNIQDWAQKHFEEEFEHKERILTSSLWTIVDLKPPNSPDADRFSTLIAKLEKQRIRAAKKQRRYHLSGEPVKGYSGPEVLLKVCSQIRSTFTFLKEKPFFYFIDDYSTPKITEDLQENLNRLFMHRSSDAFFKLSTESPISFCRRDVDGKQFVEEREHDLLNLGIDYLVGSRDQVKAFLEDLFARRFKLVPEFPVHTLVDLLGDYPRNENEAAEKFRKKQGDDSYFGIQTISAMCSGDIHYMIRLVGRMVEDAGGIPHLSSTRNNPKIEQSKQAKSIRAAAGDFLEAVRILPKHGEDMAEVISVFGKVAHSHLMYKNSKNQSGNPPCQISRIEPYETLKLSDKAKPILYDLIRFSILLVDSRGKSRRGDVVPRYYLRRYLIPHFRLTFSRRDSLSLENHEIELLLTDPRSFERKKHLKSSDTRQKNWLSP